MFPGKFFRGVARAVSVASAAVAWCGVVQTACGGGYDVDGRPLRRQTPFGEVDGMRSTVGDVADFAAGAGVSSNDVVSISRGVAREEVAPVSNLVAAVSSELGGKVDREDGKGLSSNDFTDGDAEKLGILDVRSGASDRRVAIGYGADAPGDAGTGGDAVAVGCEARAEAQSSVQFGAGTNAVGRSMQFRGANLFVVQSTASGATASLGGGFPMASRTVAGAVKVGDNVSVTADGVISVAPAPSEYVRDASRSQDGKTLTLTRNDGTTVSFQGGGGSVDSVNGQTGTVVLTGADIKTSGDDEETLADKVVTLGTVVEEKQDALTDAQIAVLDNLEGGKIVTDSHGLTVNNDSYGDSGSPTLNIGDEDGTVTYGGVLRVNGMASYPSGVSEGSVVISGATTGYDEDIGVVNIPPSIKKGGSEVATEDQLDGKVSFDAEAEDPLDTAEKIVARAGGLISTNNAAFCEAVRDVPPDTSGRWGEWGTIGACLAGLVVAVAALRRTVSDIAASVSENSRFLVSGDADGNGTTARIETRESGEDPWPEKPEIRFDKGYEPLSGAEMAKLDKSVQTITLGVGASSLDIVLPDAVDGTVRELVVYVKAADSDCALNFPAGTYYGDNPNGAKAVAGGVTAVYLTEMGEGGWMLRIVELEQHTVGATA